MYTLLAFWYVRSPKRLLGKYGEMLRLLEGHLAVKETAKHLSEPLFQDFTREGRLIGALLRLARIAMGLLVYCVASVGYAIFLVLWFIFPVVCLVSLLGSFLAPQTTAVIFTR